MRGWPYWPTASNQRITPSRLLAWDDNAGPAQVSTQWNRLLRRLRAARDRGEFPDGTYDIGGLSW